MLVLWRALVVQVSQLLESGDGACAKSDRVDAFTSMMSALRLVVTGRLLQPPQLLVGLVCFVAFSLFIPPHGGVVGILSLLCLCLFVCTVTDFSAVETDSSVNTLHACLAAIWDELLPFW